MKRHCVSLSTSFFRFWVALIALHLPSATSAATELLERQVYQTVPFGESYANLALRKDLVANIIAYWDDFDERVPRPSPSEKEWIESELSYAGERLDRAFSSAEFALFQIENHIQDCLGTLSQIRIAQGSPQTQNTEMYYWVKLINCYDGSNDILIYLQRAGLSNGRADGAFKMQGTSIVQDVLINKVIPSAMADTMGWSLSTD